MRLSVENVLQVLQSLQQEASVKDFESFKS